MANFDMLIAWAKENATKDELKEIERIEFNEWMEPEEENWLWSIANR